MTNSRLKKKKKVKYIMTKLTLIEGTIGCKKKNGKRKIL
jgi:hypothetical protein